MGIKSLLSKPFSKYVAYSQDAWSKNASTKQSSLLAQLINKAKFTKFGQEHHFKSIKSHNDFIKQVPVRDYEGFRDYIDLVISGKPDILWPDQPIYFAKTSGTTSGTKYIPISKESIAYHIQGARDALLNYIAQSGKSSFLDGKLIFLSGNPTLDLKNGIHVGRLSGIVNHHIPTYLKANQLPDFKTNCIEDWETKLDAIVDITLGQKMTLISGIPPWVQMYFDKIINKTGKSISEVFPDFSLFVYGGVNFSPYQKKLYESIGKPIDSIETFPASEGFFAYQHSMVNDGLLLLLDHGIFYEFIPIEEYGNVEPSRLSIDEVELDKNYALVITTNAGLWSYSMGDTIKFVSKNPYKIIVTGRTKHFISAFGEHVIGEEVEKAMKAALEANPEVRITEFTVAPYVSNDKGKSFHEWWIAFAQVPHDSDKFQNDLDNALVQINTYYADLIEGNILQKLKIRALPEDTFVNYMKSIGKLGGQNKVPRLSNDRNLVNQIENMLIKL